MIKLGLLIMPSYGRIKAPWSGWWIAIVSRQNYQMFPEHGSHQDPGVVISRGKCYVLCCVLAYDGVTHVLHTTAWVTFPWEHTYTVGVLGLASSSHHGLIGGHAFSYNRLGMAQIPLFALRDQPSPPPLR